jgi:hypothetical protein
MQAHTITIAFPRAAEDNLMHQVRNFAEDLWLEFRGTRLATVENTDTVIDRVCVHVTSSGRVLRAMRVVRTCLDRHLMADWDSLDRCTPAGFISDPKKLLTE